MHLIVDGVYVLVMSHKSNYYGYLGSFLLYIYQHLKVLYINWREYCFKVILKPFYRTEHQSLTTREQLNMKLIQSTLLTTYATLALFAGSEGVANAGLITSAVSVTTNMGTNSSTLLANLNNQSGLSTGYASGVDDFATYLATNPTHTSVHGADWGSSSSTTGHVDFDLGTSMSVVNIALWNWSLQGFSLIDRAVTSLQVFTSNDVTFNTGVTDHGVFAITVPGVAATNAQELNLTQSNAQYVRLDILANNGGSPTALGEVAFDIEPSAAVPEPTNLALLPLGIAAFGVVRRKRVT